MDFRVNLVDVKLEIDAIRAMEEEEEGKEKKKCNESKKSFLVASRTLLIFILFPNHS